MAQRILLCLVLLCVIYVMLQIIDSGYQASRALLHSVAEAVLTGRKFYLFLISHFTILLAVERS